MYIYVWMIRQSVAFEVRFGINDLFVFVGIFKDLIKPDILKVTVSVVLV